MPDLYRRADSADRGRHLVANCDLERGRLVLAERPIVALPSLDNQRYHALCHCCLAFVGGPHATLKRRIGERNVPDIPCRGNCGHSYCSKECERDAWQAHHFCLCTGQCDSDQDALVRFKTFCVETNEILLLVAEWWVAQHTIKSRDPQRHLLYTDFQMNPWWSVLTEEMLKSRPGSFVEASQLQQTLEKTCTDAANLLNQVFEDTNIPAITALDVAVRVGACEQNAMGIRQRSPLCRDIFNILLSKEADAETLRALLQCLDEAGFIGNQDDKEDDNEDDHGDESDDAEKKAKDNIEATSASGEEQEGEAHEADGDWDYSGEEIANFISNLRIDEDGSVRDLAVPLSGSDLFGIGDDLDLLFPPLDGTAMYSITCKMNHSCDPNIMVVYRRLPGWGRHFPLTAFCVAIRDIQEDEELTISYIDANEPFEQRTKALSSYGFSCHCSRCAKDAAEKMNGRGDQVQTESPSEENGTIEDLFDSESNDSDSDRSGTSDPGEGEDGYRKLQRVQERLDSTANHSRFGHLPQKVLGPVSSFVVRTAKYISDDVDAKGTEFSGLLVQCVAALEQRDYCLAKIVGDDLESSITSLMKEAGRFSDQSERLLYWVAALTSAIGLSHDYNFMEAQKPLDKAYTLGLNSKTSGYMELLGYVEKFSSQMSRGPFLPAIMVNQEDETEEDIMEQLAFATTIRFPVQRSHLELTPSGLASILSKGEPVAFHKLFSHWRAMERWRNLEYLVDLGGYREVPVEVGSMQDGMEESFMTFRTFAESFLFPSIHKGVWSLDDCSRNSKVAYIAQHPLQGQISALYDDVSPLDFFENPPTETMMWVGTGGTRTPLHFDTYDNLFVQVVGFKYIRLFRPDQSPKLYATAGGSFAKQGNMSEVDCEREDFGKHPLVVDAVFTEMILGPGDSVFIPAHTWHYVRSFTTSISINFWI